MLNLLLAAPAARCTIALLAVITPSAAFGEAPPVPMPPEIAAHVPADLRSYFIAFMVNPAVPKTMPHELFVRHQAHIRRQIEAGAYHVVGPVSDAGRIRGVIILSAGSLDEARKIAEGDPAVQEKVLEIEVHPAVFPNLSSLKVSYPPRPKP